METFFAVELTSYFMGNDFFRKVYHSALVNLLLIWTWKMASRRGCRSEVQNYDSSEQVYKCFVLDDN